MSIERERKLEAALAEILNCFLGVGVTGGVAYFRAKVSAATLDRWRTALASDPEPPDDAKAAQEGKA